jgi:radical SAM superfamily enzyme YgiQ (UPF0313 family)
LAKSVYTAEEKPNLSQAVLPRWDLIQFKNYATVAAQYTRGCPFNCEFCDITRLYGKTTRSKGIGQFISEIQHLFDCGARGGLFVVDDNFVGNIKEAKLMLPYLVEWQRARGYPFALLTEASVNLAKDKELMCLMRDAGFVKVFLGIETPNKEGLQECHKGQNVNTDLVDVVKTIQAHGMEVMGGFIVGFDSDPATIFEDQIAFIKKTGIVVAMVGMLNALPKTDLWERLKKAGRLKGGTTGDNADAQTNIVPKMGEEALISGYKRILSELYSRKGYYERVHTLLRNLKPVRSEKFKWTDAIALFQSVVRIGIFSGARFSYWRLLLTHCTNRYTFPLAIQFAIVGEHFMKVSRGVVSSRN